MFENAVSSIMTMLILIGTGCFLQGRSWFCENGKGLLSKFVLNLAVPVNMVYTMRQVFESREALLVVPASLPLPLLSLLLTIGICLLALRIRPVPQRRRGAFIGAATFINSIFIGVPICQAMFGDVAVPIAMVYYIANTALFWTVGVWLMKRDGGHADKVFSVEGLKMLLAPPFAGFLLGACLVLLDIPIPKILRQPMQMLSQTSTPLAMLYIGCVIRGIHWKKHVLPADLPAVLGLRFIAAPMLTILLCMAAPLPDLTKQVFVIYSAIPTMAQVAIVAHEQGSDYEFASLAVSASTLLGMLVLPGYVLLMERLHLFGL